MGLLNQDRQDTPDQLTQLTQLTQCSQFPQPPLLTGPGRPYGLQGLTTPLVEVMPPPANRLIDLLKTHYPAFEQTQPLQDHVRQAMRMVTACHTSALGGHVERCPSGHLERIFYNSCGHRYCPRCAGRLRRKWLHERQAKLLPVPHYHAVFTVPHAFNDLWRWNPRELGDLLFHSATDALRALLADPRHLGGEPGITMTLETWDDRLRFHPHGHCLVTGGGLTPEGRWKDVPHPRCLVPVSALMWEFRKRFCQGLTQALCDATLRLPAGTTPRQWLNTVNRVNRQKWEVFIAPPPEDGGPSPQDILRYQAAAVAGGPLSGDRLVPSVAELSETRLAYLKSLPLSESRLEESPTGEVRFRWGAYDPATGRRDRREVETLAVDAFLRRYLQHIPPPHYQTVRHYGLYTSGKKRAYEQGLEILSARQPPAALDASPSEPVADTAAWMEAHTCPVCGQPLVVSALLPSTRTGKVIPRVRLGQVCAHAPPATGGVHAL